MNKALLIASLFAAVALTACGKKEEMPAPAPVAAPAAVADMAASAAGMAASAADMAASGADMAAAAAAAAASMAASK